VMKAAGLAPVSVEAARLASEDGSLLTCVLMPYSLTDSQGIADAPRVLDELKPDLLFSTERVGRNSNGIYYNMRGRDYGMGRARVDHLFDAASARGIPVVAVGDGGNVIGMGKISGAVHRYVPYGANGSCPCGGGIGAVTGADVLVTAACSNWGCTAIAAAMAVRTGDPRLLHTPEAEARLLEVMVSAGLINSTHGLIDPHVDGIAKDCHIAVAELCRSIVRDAFSRSCLGPDDKSGRRDGSCFSASQGAAFCTPSPALRRDSRRTPVLATLAIRSRKLWVPETAERRSACSTGVSSRT